MEDKFFYELLKWKQTPARKRKEIAHQVASQYCQHCQMAQSDPFTYQRIMSHLLNNHSVPQDYAPFVPVSTFNYGAV